MGLLRLSLLSCSIAVQGVRGLFVRCREPMPLQLFRTTSEPAWLGLCKSVARQSGLCLSGFEGRVASMSAGLFA